MALFGLPQMPVALQWLTQLMSAEVAEMILSQGHYSSGIQPGLIARLGWAPGFPELKEAKSHR